MCKDALARQNVQKYCVFGPHKIRSKMCKDILIAIFSIIHLKILKFVVFFIKNLFWKGFEVGPICRLEI